MSHIEVSDATFEMEVVQRSHEVPVVVDFWAAWCAPCRALGPVLEKLAAEADGAWVLAKLDVDASPASAAAFGIQGIPAVKAFKDGRVVAEFVGALPEPRVRDWLAGLGPSPADLAAERGRAAEQRGDLDSAAAGYRKALDLAPGHEEARSGLARVELGLRAGGLDEAGLRARVEEDPNDAEAVFALADLDAARGDLSSAFERLLAVVRASVGDERDAARRRLIDLLDTIPADDPRALRARKALSAALF